MRIAEIYQSIQGEGRLTGTESVFVRASGCNLRCWFCDTPYASWSPEGADLSVDEIVQQVQSCSVRHVVLTGGEPMLFAEMLPLCAILHELDKHITIETAGTLHLPLHCDLMSISPKLSSSAPALGEHPKWRRRHLQTMHQPDVIRALLRDYDCQVKFVVDTESELAEIEDYLAAVPEISRNQVMLMPQGTTAQELNGRRSWLEMYCAANSLVYCPRKQIEWFGLVRRT